MYFICVLHTIIAAVVVPCSPVGLAWRLQCFLRWSESIITRCINVVL